MTEESMNMGKSIHGRWVCSCGAVIAQCRCIEGHREEKVIEHGCDDCRRRKHQQVALNQVADGYAEATGCSVQRARFLVRRLATDQAILAESTTNVPAWLQARGYETKGRG
jgi:predicted Ser/Thr protein kinase